MSYLSEVESFSSRSAWVAKYGGAVAMYIIAWKIRWQHNLSLTDPRSDFESAMTTWFDALEGREFHGGSTPDLADLSVYGALRSTDNLRCALTHKHPPPHTHTQALKHAQTSRPD
jgi:microsomal prostaglandin-E synthase 2